MRLGRADLAGAEVYGRGGCVFCAGRGLRGRIGLFELFRPNVDIQSAIADGASEHEIRRLNQAAGGRTLLDDGIDKCLAGLSTVEEVGRVTFSG
jgi:type II secretory ATPase GspE/PulE/Tfp pilus assembly ATPase PilB-like protein